MTSSLKGGLNGHLIKRGMFALQDVKSKGMSFFKSLWMGAYTGL